MPDNMRHLIQFVEADELPAEQEWALVRTEDEVVLFIKCGCLTPRSLEEAWGAYRMLADREKWLLRAV